MKVVLGVLLLVAGCQSLRHAAPACAPVTSAAQPPTHDQLLALAGDFRILAANTSTGAADATEGERLHLMVADSATVAQSRERTLGRFPRKNLQLVGNATGSGIGRPNTAEVDAGTLYVGCRDCMDASPTQYRILEITQAGFRGTWRNNMTGIAVLVDSRGRPQPNPSGYYCALRF